MRAFTSSTLSSSTRCTRVSNGVIHLIDSVLQENLDLLDIGTLGGFDAFVAAVQAANDAGLSSALRFGKPDDLNVYLKGGIEYPGSAAGWAYMPDIVGEAASIVSAIPEVRVGGPWQPD